jgi:hypothetical protein
LKRISYRWLKKLYSKEKEIKQMEENNVIMNETPVNPVQVPDLSQIKPIPLPQAPAPIMPQMPVAPQQPNPQFKAMDYAVGGFAIVGVGSTIYFLVKGGIYAYKKIKESVDKKKAAQAAEPAEAKAEEKKAE